MRKNLFFDKFQNFFSGQNHDRKSFRIDQKMKFLSKFAKHVSENRKKIGKIKTLQLGKNFSYHTRQKNFRQKHVKMSKKLCDARKI